MIAAVRRFHFLRGFGTSLIYYGCNTILDQTQIIDHLVRALLGNGIAALSVSAIISISSYFGILLLCALWYFADAKSGPWDGVLLGLICGIGIAVLDILENEMRRVLGFPIRILYLNVGVLLWLPLVLLFAAFGAKYRDSRADES